MSEETVTTNKYANCRTVVSSITYDKSTFKPVMTVMIKQPGETTGTVLGSIELDATRPKYTHEQLEKISKANTLLVETGMDVMSELETEMFVEPFGPQLKHLEEEMEDPEKLARLAGYKVEKKVTYIG